MLSERLPPRPVLKFYAFMATSSAALATPIWVLFLRANDLSYTAIMALDALYWLGIVAGELPTGYLGDRVGWRNSLIVGNVLRAVSVVAMGLSATVPQFAVVYLVWALGSTMLSGSRDAWLYEIIERRLDDETFTRVRGRGESLTLAAGAVGAVGGGALGTIDYALPFLVTGAVWAVGVGVLLTFPTVAVDEADRIDPRAALPILREAATRPALRWTVVRVGVVLAVVGAVGRFTQPVAVDLGVPVAGLGPLYAGFVLLAAGASARADWIETRLGLDGWLLFASVLFTAGLLASWSVALLALPTFVTLRGVRAVTRPVANNYLNERIGTAGRATVLSGASMAYSLIAVPFAVGGGLLADATDPYTAMGVIGVVLAVVTLVGRRLGTPAAAASAAGDG